MFLKYPLSISWTEPILGFFSGQIKEETFEEVFNIFAFKKLTYQEN